MCKNKKLASSGALWEGPVTDCRTLDKQSNDLILDCRIVLIILGKLKTKSPFVLKKKGKNISSNNIIIVRKSLSWQNY